MPRTQTMRFHACISDHEDTTTAAEQIVEQAKENLADPDVAFLFFTAHHRDGAAEVVEKIWLELDPQAAIGCSAEGVIGGELEIERSPGMSLLVGQLPGVRVHPFHIGSDDWRKMLADSEAMLERLGHGETTRAIIGFGDPWTTPLTQFMQ